MSVVGGCQEGHVFIQVKEAKTLHLKQGRIIFFSMFKKNA